jgi:hypothetical protein
VNFDLVYAWNGVAVLKKMIQMMFEEIAHSDVSDFSLLLQFDESFPSLQSDISVCLIGWFVLSSTRPMDQN